MPNAPKISLEDAKRLVACLEMGDNDTANQIIDSATQAASVELFEEVGKLTRQLHNSIGDFHLDDRIAGLATEDIPDAKNRLNYVLEMTEKSANKTMDAVEDCFPIAEDLDKNIKYIIPTWDKLMNRQIELSEFKTLCHDLDSLLKKSQGDAESLKVRLNDVLMAQDFQDLTGQVIRRVIDLVKEVEDNLIHLLTVFGETQTADKIETTVNTVNEGPEGPIIDAEERVDAVANQDEVDDLLSSLGF